jgi:hypothetical protein
MSQKRRDVLQGMAAAGSSLYLSRLLASDKPAVQGGLLKLKGDVWINDEKALRGQEVRPGDTVATGAKGEAVYVMGKDAYLLRNNSTVSYTGAGVLVTGLRLLTGKMLAVFGTGNKRIETPSATIGIRGTGCYIESDPDKVYFCLCYGTADLVPTGDPGQAREVVSNHHDRPFYIDRTAATGLIRPARAKNHQDVELTMLEALVGRRPPFLNKKTGSGYTSSY